VISTWSGQRETKHCRFQFEEDSYAAHLIDEIGARAETAYAACDEWFPTSEVRPPISIFLTDWRTGPRARGWTQVGFALIAATDDIMCLPVSPEQPASGLERAIIELHVRFAVDALPPGVVPLLNALARLLEVEFDAHTRSGDEDRVAYARQARTRGGVHPFAEDVAAGSAPDAADVSFLTYLLRRAGRPALARFVARALESSIQQAALSAYGTSLEALRTDWIANLTVRERGASGTRNMLRRAMPLLRPYRLRVALVILLMIYDLAFALAIPLSTKILFDDILGGRQYSLLPIWIAGLFVAFAVGSYLTYRRMMLAGWVAESVLRDLRQTLFRHLQTLSLSFYAGARIGDLLSRMTSDLDVVEGALGNALPALVFSTCSLVAGAVALLLLNWMLGLFVVVIGLPTYTAVYLRATERLGEQSLAQQQRLGEMAANLQENLLGQQVVKSFGLERRAIRAFEQIADQLFRGTLGLIHISGILSGASEMIGVGIRLAVMGIGVGMIFLDQLTVGGLVAFLGLIGEVLGPVTAISGYFAHLQQASGSLERIDEILSEGPAVPEDPLAVVLAPLKREVCLERVSFGYQRGEAVLRDLDLVIPAHSKVAVVGPSGAGKSTLAGLLQRLYDPSAGRVLFDGQDLRTASLASVRRQTAVVPQETFLFDATIEENIALGREGATHANVVTAAHAAALDDVVEHLEHGYATPVGERGVRLSGGQRQRLAIARALIRNPHLLILDEATSALDPETEASILDTLESAASGRTVIMITHRMAAAALCDQILVLDQGRLVESGTHDDLLRRGGLYWRLHSEQQSGALDVSDLPVSTRRLSRVPILASLSPIDLALVSLRMSIERYETGRVIVRQGDPADRLFVIADGQVEVFAEDERGAQTQLTILGPDSFFGEIALLGHGDSRRSASVRALSELELYSLHRDDFVQLLRAHPALAEEVGTVAERRLAQVHQVLASVQRGPTDDVPGSAPPRRALLTVRKDGSHDRQTVLDGRALTIGRANANDLQLQDDTVSRRHCRVWWSAEAGWYLVEDLGSSNGTRVNGQRVGSTQLHDGDVLQLGRQTLEFKLDRETLSV
jgi:ATP-binding cassette subfamily B protein